MESTTLLSGQPATVLGTPRVIDEAGVKATYFDGVGDGLLLSVNPLEGLNQFTIEVLIKPDANGEEAQRFLHIQDNQSSRALLEIRLARTGWALDTFLRSEKTTDSRTQLDRAKLHFTNRWTWVALVYAHGHMANYVDGVKELEGPVDFPAMQAGKISLGMRQNKVFWYKGGIREVRFHALALDAAMLQKPATQP